jgi:hypothetical protein
LNVPSTAGDAPHDEFITKEAKATTHIEREAVMHDTVVCSAATSH